MTGCSPCCCLVVAPVCARRSSRRRPLGTTRESAVDEQPGASGAGRVLELQFRQRLAEVVRRRLNLDDNQMRSSAKRTTSSRRQRMQLLREERRARQALRAEVLAGDAADQKKVAGLIDRDVHDSAPTPRSHGERAARARDVHDADAARAIFRGSRISSRRRMEDLRGSASSGAGPDPADRRPLPLIAAPCAYRFALRRACGPATLRRGVRPGGGIGRRRGLKIPRPLGLTSSSLVPGTNRRHRLGSETER